MLAKKARSGREEKAWDAGWQTGILFLDTLTDYAITCPPSPPTPPHPTKTIALKGLSWRLPHILVFNVMPCSTLGRCYSSVHLHITYGAARHYQGRLMSSNPDKPDARKSHICRDLISCIFLRSFKPTFSISNFSNIYLCCLFPGNRQRILLFYSLKIEEIKNRKHIRPSAWMQC